MTKPRRVKLIINQLTHQSPSLILNQVYLYIFIQTFKMFQYPSPSSQPLPLPSALLDHLVDGHEGLLEAHPLQSAAGLNLP